jgi:hypothetical protein
VKVKTCCEETHCCKELDSVPVAGTAIRKFNIRNNYTLAVEMNVYDEENHKFVDVSSLDIEWGLSEKKFAQFTNDVKKTMRQLAIGEEEGFLIVNGTIHGLDMNVLTENEVP